MAMADPGSGAFLFCSADESIHNNLRENDEEFTDLQLWLNASTNIHDLADALWHNTTVQEALLLIHESFGGNEQQPEHEVLLLFAVLGRLPQLSRLFFNTYRFPFVARLPVRAFSNVFRSARNLVEFKLWRTDLCVTTARKQEQEPSEPEQQRQQQQLHEWAKALASSQCLREFRLIKCRLTTADSHATIAANTTTTTTTTSVGRTSIRNDDPCCGYTLDPILQALAKLPNLRDVELSATKLAALGNLSQTTLRQIVRAPRLQSFSLTNFDLSEDAVVAIAQSLLPQQYNDDIRGRGRSTIRSKPTTNRSQSEPAHPSRRVSNHHSNHIHSNRSSVKQLRLSGVGSTASMFTKPIRDAFRQVLQYNYRLERLFLFDNRNLQEEISFYLKLNRLGRQRLLMHEASRREWIETLVHVRDDLDCLFYFLGINPLLLICRGNHKDENDPTTR